MRILFFCFLLLLHSCASDYKKGIPDFNKMGDEKAQERAKYEMISFSSTMVNFTGDWYTAGYRTKTVIPMMKKVSPKSVEKYEELKKPVMYQRLFMGAFVAIAAYEFYRLTKVNEYSPTVAFWALGGLAIGYNIHLQSRYDGVRNQYNKDLYSKFEPMVSWRKSF